MQSFTMPPLPADAPAWARIWAKDVETAIKKAAFGDSSYVRLRYLTTGPDRPQDGAIYALDSTNSNAASGTGMYRYTASSTSYSFLG